MICQLRTAVVRAGIFKSNLNFKYAFKVIHLLRHLVFMKAFLGILILRRTAVAKAMLSKERLRMRDCYT